MSNAPSALARAEAAQRAASNPTVSAFVAASAGSGKTKLLTDRLLRLMLDGAKPERILCLTYTRAAAAEMALRLQRRLAAWVVASEDELDGKLRVLGVAPSEDVRAAARALFARVLDLPGGMRISTIHAFCQSVLRRFPLEAHLAPRFELAADEDAERARCEAVRAVLARTLDDVPATAAVARLVEAASSEEALDALCAKIGANERFATARKLAPLALGSALRRTTGAPAEPMDPAVVAEEATLARAVAEIAEHGAKGVAERAKKMLEWLARSPEKRRSAFDDWAALFRKKNGEPLAGSNLVNKKLADAEPDLLEALLKAQAGVLDVLDARGAEAAAVISGDLSLLAVPALASYAAAKEAHGRLDYADLIRLANRLLVDPGAAWVLYKLDGGLEHLLLDEAQDTAPEQWAIADALTAEFFAGVGAEEGHRTVFAVGDPKQSIYFFQGADPAGFARARERFGARVAAAGERWVEQPLDVSFRSTAPVLALVDAVFRAPDAAVGVVRPGETLHHDPVRAGAQGSVELWPLAPPDESPEFEPWHVPEANLSTRSGANRLAAELARWIAREAGGGVQLESRGRPLRPRDVLVLVRARQRGGFARALVKALKAENVPVAGLDRMALAEEPAVRDVLALARALLLPEDDLAFATFLTSPLGGLDDRDLLALCPGRERSLYEVLEARESERASWGAAFAFFAALFRRADYAGPYALLAEALGPLGGRSRLYARFGTEAAEPLDELLAAALRYAGANTPSLQGFVAWLAHSGVEVKREPEGQGEAVRLMTVHGAKGLQAPLVILPDTTGLPPDANGLPPGEQKAILAADDPVSRVTLPLYLPSKRTRSRAIEKLLTARGAAVMAEYNRLLYVAMTRAEDRLLVAGWATKKAIPERCWYRLVARGFEELAADTAPFARGWEGDRRWFATRQRSEPTSEVARREMRSAPLPAWAGSAPDWRPAAPPAEPAPAVSLAPSRPANATLGPIPPANSPLALRDTAGRRFRRGTLIHHALQHVFSIPWEARDGRLRAFFTNAAAGLGEEEIEKLVRMVTDATELPALAPLFAPDARAEVPLTGLINGRVVGGLVDRLAVLTDRVLVADFKTNRRPPASLADTPPLYLGQMAAYRAVLRGVFPDRPVSCFLVWTEAMQVDRLPDALLDPHNPSPTEAQGFPA